MGLARRRPAFWLSLLVVTPFLVGLAGAEGLALPDLTIESYGIEPANPAAGDVITFYAVVRNEGMADANYHRDDIRLVSGYGSATYGGLLTGDSRMISFERVLAEGDHQVRVQLDVEGDVAESDEADNALEFTVHVGPGAKPDLVVESVTITLPTKESRWDTQIRVKVANVGSVPSGPTTMLVRAGDHSHEFDVYALEAGDNRAGGTLHAWLPGGVHEVTVVVDPEGTLAEEDETNNAWAGAVDVPRADLVLSDLQVSVREGESVVEASVRVTNVGDFPASGHVRFFLDGEAADQSSSLEPGESAVLNVEFVQIRGGLQNVTVVADVRGDTNETDEGNNALTTAVELPEADLAVRIVSVDQNEQLLWPKRTLVVEACNEGAWWMEYGRIDVRMHVAGIQGHGEADKSAGGSKLWELDPGECRSFTFEHIPRVIGEFKYVATVTTAESDADASNDRAVHVDHVLVPGAIGYDVRS